MTLTKPHTFTARLNGHEASADCPVEAWVTVFWMIDLPVDIHRAGWSAAELRASGYIEEAARKRAGKSTKSRR